MPEYIIYRAEVDPNPESPLEVDYIGLVDKPAIQKNFQVFNDQKVKAKFTLNEEKHIISGPAMIADLPIYRKDDQLGEYYVIFDKEGIQTIVQKFSAKGYMSKFNLFHDASQQVNDITIFNSFVTDIELGINPIKGFEDCPDGSWFISAKVNNEDVWNIIKEGKVKGFSVEGLFSYISVAKVKMSSEQLFEMINKLINETEIID